MKYENLKKMIMNSPAVFEWLYMKKTEEEKKKAGRDLGFGDYQCESDMEQSLLVWHIFWGFMLITGVIFLIYFFMSIIRLSKIQKCDADANSKKTNAAILIAIALVVSWIPALGPILAIILLCFAGAQMDKASKNKSTENHVSPMLPPYPPAYQIFNGSPMAIPLGENVPQVDSGEPQKGSQVMKDDQ